MLAMAVNRRRVAIAGFVVAFVLGGLLAMRLAGQDRDGPPHVGITIGDGIPATLYVPGEVDRDFQQLPDPRPEGERPPVVVLAHGFAVDRAIMSPLARSLVAHGYAVVSFDWRGHGSNRQPFHNGNEELRDDLTAVVDWVEDSPRVDSRRLVVMGHSMGAAGVLDFANRDPRPAAVVPISGAAPITGPVEPANVGFVVAEDDPQPIHDEIEHAYEALAGEPPGAAPAETGSHGEGTAVGLFEIDGTDHGTVLLSGETVDTVVEWTDASLAIDRQVTHGRVDARLGTAALYLLVLLVMLAGVGLLAARFVQPLEEVPRPGAWGGLLVITVAMIAAAPFVSGPPPGGFVELRAGDSLQSFFVVAGALMLLLRAAVARQWVPAIPERWVGRGLDVGKTVRPAILPALLTVAAVYVLMLPLSPVFHRLVPTPERLLTVPVMAALTLPFTVAFHTLIRRGSVLASTLMSILGRLVILLLLFVLAGAGVLPFVVVVIIPFLAAIFVLVEVVSASIYAGSRNVAVIALVEAAWLGWIAAVTMPIGFGPLA